MIGYATLGTNNLKQAQGFYDALMEEVGAKRLMEMDEGFTMYGTEFGQPSIATSMLWPLLISIAGFIGLIGTLSLMNLKNHFG